MKTYLEHATDVAYESQIAVQVLLSRGNDDLELIPVKPESNTYITGEEFTARQLRSVGVIGLRGLQPAVAFKEPLPPLVLRAISAAFVAYVGVLLGDSFAAQLGPVADVAELERIFALPDTRMN